MKNLISTEKMLKHWLKKKVTITTATVVGFLLMGTSAFGNTTEQIIEENTTHKEQIRHDSGNPIIKVINKGKIIINLDDAIYSDLSGIRLQEQNKGIRKELINNGRIEVKLTDDNKKVRAAVGVKLLGNANIINNGDIKVNANDGSIGILSMPTKEFTWNGNLVENNGTVEVNSTDGKGIALTVNTGKNDLNKVLGEVLVVNNGTLKTNGQNVVNLQNGKINFINNGSIILSKGNGYAISATSDSDVEGIKIENKGIISIPSTGKVAFVVNDKKTEVKSQSEMINTGIIKISDKSKEELKAFDIIKLFNIKGNSSYDISKGMLVDKNGIAVGNDKDVTLAGDISTSDVNTAGKDLGKVVLGKYENTTLLGSSDPAKMDTIDIVSHAVKVGNGIQNTTENEVTLSVKSLNIDADGSLALSENSILKIEDATINKVGEKKDGLTLSKDSFLVLENTTAKTNIVGTDNKGNLYTLGNTTVNGDITVAKVEVSEGKTTFNGEISAPTINIGKSIQPLKVTENGKETEGYFTSNSKFTKETTVDATNGVFTIAVAEDKSNVLANSTEKVTVKGNVDFDYSSLTENTTVALRNDKVKDHDLKEAKVLNNKDSVYNVTIDDNTDTAKFEYNKKLLSDFGSELNAVNTGFQVINDVVSQAAKTTKERAELADKFYSSNIYSETVKAAYDNVKMNEEAVESLARKSEIGKWTAEGKALYSKNEYDRKGIVGDYSSEIESTGLMAAYGYGLNETTTAGIAFSGVKQDVDTATGSADADLFYLGVYGNKVVGNYDFTAGLGYQFGKYEADNNILAGTGDKYDSQTVSGYVQGRYTADLGDGLSVQPKVKLGYTYVKQDDAKDSYFGVEDAEVSTFDAEAGFDVVKSVQLEKSKVDVKFGASYIRTMGDTDEEFTGRFYGAKASEGFNVLGAELAENVVKFNLGAEVTNENGFFYNGGFTYEFGSNDTEAYGVNVGAGYKF